jgi:histidine phosphotransferase ChpT
MSVGIGRILRTANPADKRTIRGIYMTAMQRLYPLDGPDNRASDTGQGRGKAVRVPGDALDLRAAELLCSRLCHDLISPVAAISNGLELLADDDGSSAAEISGLLGLSAGQAAGRLMFYRAAYGLGGDQADSMTVAAAAALVEAIGDRGQVNFRWPAARDTVLGRVGTKLMLNAAALALETLPRGGRVSVALDGAPPVALLIDAEGTGAAIRPEVAEALRDDADVDALTARSVHGYFTAWLARRHGGDIVPESRADAVRLRLHLPPRR